MDIFFQKLIPTYEDTYTLLVDTDKGREKLRIYEIGGKCLDKNFGKHFLQVVDAVLFVYDPSSPESFTRIQQLKDIQPVAFLVDSTKNGDLGHCSTVTCVGDSAFSGHFNGFVCVWSLSSRRSIHSWKADPNSTSVVGLYVIPSPSVHFVLVQARDGLIRLFHLQFDPTQAFQSQVVLTQIQQCIPCCSYTFCAFDTSPIGTGELAILFVRGNEQQQICTSKIDNIFQEQVSISTDTLLDFQDMAQFGMPMALNWLDAPSNRCILGCENGHILYCEGKQILLNFDKLAPRSVMHLSLSPKRDSANGRSLYLISVGLTPLADELHAQKRPDDSTLENLLLKVGDKVEMKVFKTGRTKLEDGVSHLAWNKDGSLLAVTCWNGTCLLWQPVKDPEESLVCNMCLPGCQFMPADDLLGDWSSTKTWDKRGGKPCLPNETLRTLHACTFTDHYLITGIPAGTCNSYVSSSLAVWDLRSLK
ncbi:hypothetical protein Ciccas_010806 [Cichlidogyrus casuarinus]|uniref:Uncharacterized protein n=1 Tax=Cichlidogyrus casuarinus TaxID=1844966 RepID=A0ABD2PT66_9PLAT